jgi:uncharacterized protein (TIGR02118 family)
MIKLVVVVHKRPDMEVEDFRRYWRETHAPIAARIPGLRRYVQNFVDASLVGTPPSFDGIAELVFDDEASLERAMASPEIEAATADNKNFLDEERLQAFVVEEVPISSGVSDLGRSRPAP